MKSDPILIIMSIALLFQVIFNGMNNRTGTLICFGIVLICAFIKLIKD